MGTPSNSIDRITFEQPNPSRTTTTITSETSESELHTLQEDNSSDDVAVLQNQFAMAIAVKLRDVRAENNCLANENQSQQRSISQLKNALDDAQREQHHSLTQIKNQLHDATWSLTVLNREKQGWQDELDLMQHKLSATERQVRCLDHLTRYKLESRQKAASAYGQPKRKGTLTFAEASTDVIGWIDVLNEKIYQTCAQLADTGLECTSISSNKYKSQAQKVLGNHLTAMMEKQAKNTPTSGYNMLLMQTVFEVFMTYWCSSIIEAFYPHQESFDDLLSQLSTRTSGLATTCEKQIQIIQPSSHVKFKEWVKHIIKELEHFLEIAGLRMRSWHTSHFSTKILPLVAIAHDLRTAMAEKDICGGLEVVTVAPDTPFQEKRMMDGHANGPTKSGGPTWHDTNQSYNDDSVAGTIGLGLQRKVSEYVDGIFQSRMNMVVRPRVVLARALNVRVKMNLSRSTVSQPAITTAIFQGILQIILIFIEFALDVLFLFG